MKNSFDWIEWYPELNVLGTTRDKLYKRLLEDLNVKTEYETPKGGMVVGIPPRRVVADHKYLPFNVSIPIHRSRQKAVDDLVILFELYLDSVWEIKKD